MNINIGLIVSVDQARICCRQAWICLTIISRLIIRCDSECFWRNTQISRFKCYRIITIEQGTCKGISTDVFTGGSCNCSTKYIRIEQCACAYCIGKLRVCRSIHLGRCCCCYGNWCFFDGKQSINRTYFKVSCAFAITKCDGISTNSFSLISAQSYNFRITHQASTCHSESEEVRV